MAMSVRDAVTWTSMISAFVLNHDPKKSLSVFREMLSSGLQGFNLMLLLLFTVLSAIAELGIVEEGKWRHHSCSFFWIGTHKHVC